MKSKLWSIAAIVLMGVVWIGCSSSPDTSTTDQRSAPITLSLVGDGAAPPADGAAPPADGAAPPADGAAPPADGAAPPADGAAPPADGAAPPVATETPAPAATPEPELIPISDRDIMDGCREATRSSKVKMLIVVGAKKTLTIDPSEAQLIRVIGNGNVLNLTIDVPKSAEVKGLCLQMSGSGNSAKISAKTPIGGVFFHVMGRNSSVSLDIPAPSHLRGGRVTEFGKGNIVKINGAGQILCPKRMFIGHGSSYTCAK